MPKKPEGPKLTRTEVRQLKKVATGPLLGAIVGDAPQPPEFGELAARPAPLGSIQSVRARMAAATEDA